MTILMFVLGVLVFTLGLALSVGLHEFGHLVPGKLYGVKVTQYFIGFGPKIWSFRRGETEYGLKAIPAGGYVKIVGRKATDLIKSGGYKIGAGEIENALLEHPAVEEAAVLGVPDDDLGERIIAWVVVEEGASRPSERELADHVARLLTPHKRPREVRYLNQLPRNAMGKVTKTTLGS